MTSTTVRQRFFRTDIPITNRSKQETRPFFMEPSISTSFKDRCKVILFQTVSFTLAAVFPQQNSFPFWQVRVLSTKFSSACQKKTHAHRSFIQIAGFAKKHPCCQGIQAIKPFTGPPRREVSKSKRYQYIWHVSNRERNCFHKLCTLNFRGPTASKRRFKSKNTNDCHFGTSFKKYF